MRIILILVLVGVLLLGAVLGQIATIWGLVFYHKKEMRGED